MQVKNVECKLAEMQIGRFVSGEALSAEAVRQLDEHLSVCAACSQVLSDRKHALQSMLSQGFAAVTTDLPPEDKENLLIKALVDKAATSPSTPRRTTVEACPDGAMHKPIWNMLGPRKPSDDPKAISLRKALIYSGVLGVVLFAMGYLSHSQDSLLGSSAEQAFPAATAIPPQPSANTPDSTKKQPAQTAAQNSKPATSSKGLGISPSKPIPDHSVKNGSDKISPDRNTSVDASEPHKAPAKAVVHHPRKYVPAAHKRPIRSRVQRHSHFKPQHHSWKRIARPSSGVRIYDASGKPIRS
jgi:hypothetical protein